MLCVQRSWTTLTGGSPVSVIASEPCSQTRCAAVMQGAKRVGKVTSIRGASNHADRNIK